MVFNLFTFKEMQNKHHVLLLNMLNRACTFYRRKMYAHADLELQWLHIILNPETRVISVFGS